MVEGEKLTLRMTRSAKGQRSRRDTSLFDNFSADIDNDSEDDYLTDSYISNEVHLFENSSGNSAGKGDENAKGQTKQRTDERSSSLNAVLLVSGENDDLSGDFMAAVIVNGIVEFR